MIEPNLVKECFRGLCGQRRPRSACASAQADQGLRCSLTESLATVMFPVTLTHQFEKCIRLRLLVSCFSFSIKIIDIIPSIYANIRCGHALEAHRNIYCHILINKRAQLGGFLMSTIHDVVFMEY